LTLKLRSTIVNGLASKPLGQFSLVWPENRWRQISPGFASKSVARVSWFEPQNRQQQFGDLGVKITATVSWFRTQNQVGDGLSVAPQNRREDATAWDTH
jgi:hypothetical protein